MVQVSQDFSQQYIDAPWSWDRVDLLQHLWLPLSFLGWMALPSCQVMRANLLDELKKPYMEMARPRVSQSGASL